MRSFFRLFLFFLAANQSFAQQLNFSNYGLEEGLPQSTVFEIFQDRDGFLWVGTDGGGMARFDGYRFKTFSKAQGLRANVVRSIVQDQQGTIWAATNNGLYYLHGDTARPFDQISNNREMYFFSVYVDAQNSLWASTLGQGVYRITGPKKSHEIKHYSSSTGLSGDYIFDVTGDHKGRVYLASFGKGIDVLQPDGEKIEHIGFDQNAMNEVITLTHLGGDSIAFGTKKAGAYIYSSPSIQPTFIPGTANDMVWSIEHKASAETVGDHKSIIAATHKSGVVFSDGSLNLNRATALATNQVLKVLTDREKNLWIGTNGAGLSKFMGKRFVHVTDQELPGLSQVTAITRDSGGTFWAGTALSGLFQFSYDGRRVELLKKITSAQGLSHDAVTSIASQDNKTWIGTRNGLNLLQDNKVRHFSPSDGLADANVNCLLADSRNRLWIGTAGGLSLSEEVGTFRNMSETNGLINNEVQCFLEDQKGNIWIGTFGGLIMYDGAQLYSYFEEDGLEEKKILSLINDNAGNIYIGTFGGGVYHCRGAGPDAKISLFCDEELSSGNIYSLTFQDDSTLIAATDRGLNKITLSKDRQIAGVSFLGRTDGFTNVENSQNATFTDARTRSLFFGTPAGITIYYPNEDVSNSVRPSIRISRVEVNGVNKEVTGRLRLPSDENSIRVEFISVSLSDPLQNEYYARLDGVDTSWTSLFYDTHSGSAFMAVEFKKLQPGKYTLQLRSRNNSKVESETAQLAFVIAPPFYRSLWFLAACIVAGVGLVYVFFKFREKRLIRANQRLEKKVAIRTAEVIASKKEIEKQKDLLQLQKMEITDSINYSKRIQNAILPQAEDLIAAFPSSFILYRPKDIVSGDFYSFTKGASDDFYVAVADCTGHGVPGAFMSMVGSRELQESIAAEADPSGILRELNLRIRKTLKQHDPETGIKDGMDIALIRTKKQSDGSYLVTFAGANRPLWIIRNNMQLEEIKGTKAAIGGYTVDEQVFTQSSALLKKGDQVYLFSDGFADQFGGAEGKKMMTRRFRELLQESVQKPMRDRGEFISAYFDAWKGTDNEQVDDVLVIGIEL